MKILIWNCRGIQKKGVSSFLRNLILEHKFMQAEIADSIIRQIDISHSYLWKWIPSQGKSGGILSGINLEYYDVGSFKEGKHILQLNLWDKIHKVKWNFLNVYGAPHDENKGDFLTELASFCSSSLEPFIIGGDFNLIRFSTEKIKQIAFLDFLGFSTQ